MRSFALNDQCFSNSVSLALTFLAVLVFHRGQQKCCCSRRWAFPVRGLIRGPQSTVMPPECSAILRAWLTTAQASWKSYGECFSNSVALNNPQIYKIWPPFSLYLFFFLEILTVLITCESQFSFLSDKIHISHNWEQKRKNTVHSRENCFCDKISSGSLKEWLFCCWPFRDML